MRLNFAVQQDTEEAGMEASAFMSLTAEGEQGKTGCRQHEFPARVPRLTDNSG